MSYNTCTLLKDKHTMQCPPSWLDLKASFIPCYLELVNTIVPGPQSVSYFVPQILLPVCLLISPSIISHNGLAKLAMPVMLASTIHAWVAMRGVDVISVDTLWWSFFFLVFKDPRRDFKRLIDDGNCETADPSDMSGVVEEPYLTQIWPRLNWVFALLSNRPLTSWRIGVASHDASVARPYIRRSRLAFIRDILQVLVPTLMITMPLALQLQAHDPFFVVAGQPLSRPYDYDERTRSIVVHSIHKTIPAILLRPLTLGMYLYSMMILMFLPPYLLPVIANFFTASVMDHLSPHTWPRPHFGPFSAVLGSGLRGLWGRWWHQQMRHAVSEPGRWLASKLNLKRGGLARYACFCISAFALSGFTHAGLVPPHPRFAETYGAWELRVMCAAFFWMQPVGILLEVTIVEVAIKYISSILARTLRSQCVLERILRLFWVLLFMSCSLVFLLPPFIELGYWNLWPPFFLSQDGKHLLRGAWIP